MYNLDALTPQEKDELLMQLLSKHENAESIPEGVPAANGFDQGGEHTDESQDLAMLKPFADVLDMLISKVEQLEERLEYNEKLVVDDLFGGIDRLYKSNMRTQGIEGLKGKYGEIFAPHMDALKELAPGEDLYETLHDMLDGLRAGGDFDDAKEMETIHGVAKGIAEKIAKIKGQPVAVEIEGSIEAPAEPEEKTEEPAAADPQAKLFDKIRDMRKKAPKSL